MLGNSRTVALALGVIVYRTREAGSNGSVRFSLVLVLVPIRPPLKNFMYLVSPVHRVPVQYPASINSNTPILRWSLTTVSNELILKRLQYIDAVYLGILDGADLSFHPVLRLGHMDIMKEQKHLG